MIPEVERIDKVLNPSLVAKADEFPLDLCWDVLLFEESPLKSLYDVGNCSLGAGGFSLAFGESGVFGLVGFFLFGTLDPRM